MTDITISPQHIRPLWVLRPMPIWREYGTTEQMDAIDMSGSLSGTVKELDVLMANAIVSLYYRPNGNLISRVRTDANGAWTVTGLDKSVAHYYAVAQTESAFNAIVYDKLQPV